jgi:hypothetical protein
MCSRAAIRLIVPVLVALHLCSGRSAAQPATVTLEFQADGRCSISARGEGFRSDLTYTPSGPSTDPRQFRCAVPPVPAGRSIILTVRLPQGVAPGTRGIPRLEWTERDGIWSGTALLSKAPEVVVVPESDGMPLEGPRRAMRRSEWIAAGYFLYLLVPIAAVRQRWSVRLVLAAVALALAAVVVGISSLPSAAPWAVVRDWAPGVYLLAGYWLPGRLYTRPNERVERWLIDSDRRLGAIGVVRGLGRRLPAFVREYLEFAYLFCYPLVPLAFGIVYFSDPSNRAASDMFWSVVLLSSYLCFGVLPWIPTRPPRVIEGNREPLTQEERGLRRVNLLVLNHASIQVNTFPSAHVAGSIASALAVGAVLPLAGLFVALIAASITAASVYGRYHYAADAALGALIAFVVFAALT